MAAIRGPGLLPVLGAQPTNEYSLPGGTTQIIPAGEFFVFLGLYTNLEYFDPIQGIWHLLANTDRTYYVDSDGGNWRVANRTGCAVGAMITNHGASYVAPVVTSSAGGSLWKAILGGRLNASVTVVTGGSGYTYPPRVVIPSPPLGNGVQATAVCTLSGGVVNAVTITNQGAGYVSAPTMTFVTDPRDPGTSIVPAAPIVQPLTGAGTISAILCTDMGSPQTSVPTLTITDSAGSSAAATVLMCFAATGYTVASGGTGFGAGTYITSGGGILTSTPADTNPSTQAGIIIPRRTLLTPALSAGVIVASATTAPLSVEDWGWGFQLIPAAIPVPGTGLATAVATPTFTVGAQTDTFFLQPARG